MNITAEEFLKKISLDKDYQVNKMKKEEDRIAYSKIVSENEKPIIEELHSIGVYVGSVWDLVNTKESYTKAIPVLFKHIIKNYHPAILEGMARALAVKETKNIDGYWNILLSLYESYEITTNPQFRGVKEGLAITLSFLCTSDKVADMLRLIEEEKHGDSIFFFKRKLGRLKKKI